MISNWTSRRPFDGAAVLILLLLSNTSASAAERAGTQAGTILFCLVAAGVFSIPIGWYYIASALEAFKLCLSSTAWPAVPGKVLSSEVGHERYSFSWVYSLSSARWYGPSVRYEYYLNNVRHEGDVIAFGELVPQSYSEAEARIQAYPPGATVTVHYDPNDPEIATLETSVNVSLKRYWTGVMTIAVVFLIAGTLFLIFGIGWADPAVIILSLMVVGGSLLFLWYARKYVVERIEKASVNPE
jgi:hypothetical protein